MSDGIDDHELRRYIADLDTVPTRLDRDLVRVGEKGALNIKKDWQAAWASHSYIGPLSRAVTYERYTRREELEWVIGPDKNREQGALGNIIEYGSPTSAPIQGGGPALDRETPRLEKHIADVTAEVISGE